jgi:uncharacterized membrane protein YtjA (UPF0391 family)
MLRAAIAFFVLAILAMALGASGIAGLSMDVAKTLLIVFLILAVLSFVASLLTGRRSTMMGLAFLAIAGTAAFSGCNSAEKRMDQALSTPSTETTTASNQQGAAAVTEVNFDQGSFVLSEGARAALKDLVEKTRSNNTIDDVKVLAWADTAYPADKNAELPRAQRDLADKRATAIADYISKSLGVKDVEKYNMASRPSTVAKWFDTDDAETKRAFENAGVTSNGGKSITGKASRAVIMLMPEKN